MSNLILPVHVAKAVQKKKNEEEKKENWKTATENFKTHAYYHLRIIWH